MSNVVLNIEANGLRPDKIWVATCIDIDTGEEYAFIRPDLSPDAFVSYMRNVARIIGHNICAYDLPVCRSIGGVLPAGLEFDVVDTLVVSRLIDFDRAGGHSLAAWSGLVGVQKTAQPPWDVFSQALVDHSLQNCRITAALYKRFLPYLNSSKWKDAIALEHFVAKELRVVHDNGFHFDLDKCKDLQYTISKELENLDHDLLTAFAPKVRLLREITPRVTKYGTLNRNDFRWAGNDLSAFNGGPFSLIEYEEFNPGSPVQIVERLNEAGWKPTEKTKGHLQALRDKNKEKLERLKITGWKVSEENLKTLPDTAPPAAKKLARRILLASRWRVLREWIDNTHADHRIHGTINHIGAWTHRCSHDKPNTGNIPRTDAEFGKEMRSFWNVEDGYLIGVDAEGIQLRVLAHYIEDERFTHAVTYGNKEEGTDPHTLNKLALGSPCKSRNDAKTFIYAWLLGAGIGKVAEILECDFSAASKANSDFIDFYPGLKSLKAKQIPYDAQRGYFQGFDGRFVKIFGDDDSSRRHFCLAGYLQAGEAIVMKTAMGIWIPKLRAEGIPFKLVNFVHDEWQTQVYGDKDVAEYVKVTQMDSIRLAGEKLNLRCPLAGSGDIGKNWLETH